MIGGTGPESTVDYYKTIIDEYKKRFPESGIPPMLINSINFQRLMEFLEPQDWKGMAEMLAKEFGKLKNAGADFGLISANTPHICYKYLEPISPLPLLDIVRCALEECLRLTVCKPLLLGTKLTMESDFYSEPFTAAGISLATPNSDDRDWINQKYFDELFVGVFLDETRNRLTEIIHENCRQYGADGVILGGTELPLILRGVDLGPPLLDTAKIHCMAAVDRITSG
jgi:aspartate racemase